MKKLTPVTDPVEVAEILTKAPALDVPFPIQSNGHVWVDAAEMRAWRDAGAVRLDS